VWRLFNAVMRVVSSLVGLLMVLMGGVWILQGLNLAWGSLSRSFMRTVRPGDRRQRPDTKFWPRPGEELEQLGVP
jgi:hypothetical protein